MFTRNCIKCKSNTKTLVEKIEEENGTHEKRKTFLCSCHSIEFKDRLTKLKQST